MFEEKQIKRVNTDASLCSYIAKQGPSHYHNIGTF